MCSLWYEMCVDVCVSLRTDYLCGGGVCVCACLHVAVGGKIDLRARTA